eukprot:357428-Chlamydomonas_euryale.AAC.2
MLSVEVARNKRAERTTARRDAGNSEALLAPFPSCTSQPSHPDKCGLSKWHAHVGTPGGQGKQDNGKGCGQREGVLRLGGGSAGWKEVRRLGGGVKDGKGGGKAWADRTGHAYLRAEAGRYGNDGLKGRGQALGQESTPHSYHNRHA